MFKGKKHQTKWVTFHSYVALDQRISNNLSVLECIKNKIYKPSEFLHINYPRLWHGPGQPPDLTPGGNCWLCCPSSFHATWARDLRRRSIRYNDDYKNPVGEFLLTNHYDGITRDFEHCSHGKSPGPQPIQSGLSDYNSPTMG